MITHNSYHTMAINIITKALLRGALLQNESGAAYGGTGDGRQFYHAIRKLFKGHDGQEENKTEYEGGSAEEAAKKLTEICGVFDAIGLAVRWYREHPNEQQPTLHS